MSSEQQEQQQQQEPNANTHNEFNAIIGRLKTAAKSDQANFNAISAEELQERLRKSRQIGFNVQASLEIEQARKRQLVETFLKREMKLPNTEDEEEKEEEKEDVKTSLRETRVKVCETVVRIATVEDGFRMIIMRRF